MAHVTEIQNIKIRLYFIPWIWPFWARSLNQIPCKFSSCRVCSVTLRKTFVASGHHRQSAAALFLLLLMSFNISNRICWQRPWRSFFIFSLFSSHSIWCVYWGSSTKLETRGASREKGGGPLHYSTWWRNKILQSKMSWLQNKFFEISNKEFIICDLNWIATKLTAALNFQCQPT